MPSLMPMWVLLVVLEFLAYCTNSCFLLLVQLAPQRLPLLSRDIRELDPGRLPTELPLLPLREQRPITSHH
jgi:hypothetical protein